MLTHLRTCEKSRVFLCLSGFLKTRIEKNVGNYNSRSGYSKLTPGLILRQQLFINRYLIRLWARTIKTLSLYFLAAGQIISPFFTHLGPPL